MEDQFIKFGARYCKRVDDRHFLVVYDWIHSKGIEWCWSGVFDPYGNKPWEIISETEFNEAHERVLRIIEQLTPKEVIE